MKSEDKIITIYPELTAFQVEIQGNPFECNMCRDMGECCGALGGNHNYKVGCEKCRCQHLYPTEDETRDKVGKVKLFNCKNCDDSKFSKGFCSNYGYLKNNLKPEITDCSNNFLVTGENNQIDDVTLKSECNIGNESVNVVEDKQEPIKSQKKIDKKFIYGGIGIFVFLIILYFLFS